MSLTGLMGLYLESAGNDMTFNCNNKIVYITHVADLFTCAGIARAGLSNISNSGSSFFSLSESSIAFSVVFSSGLAASAFSGSSVFFSLSTYKYTYILTHTWDSGRTCLWICIPP